MKINIEVTYTVGLNTRLELPIKNWSEIKKWHIRYNTLHFTLDNDTWFEKELSVGDSDNINWKNPNYIVIETENYETLEEIP